MMPRKRWLAGAALMVWLAAPAARGQDQRFLDQTTQELRRLETQIASELNPNRKRELMDEAERVRHSLGPLDAAGKRVQCQTFWHQERAAALMAEADRLTVRARADTPTAPIFQAKAAVRRMAATCLLKAWSIPESYGEARKYQIDSFGQYLANNLAAIDRVLDAVGADLVTEETDPRRAAAIASLKSAAEEMAAAPALVAPLTSFQNDVILADLERFRQNLAAIDAAERALRPGAAAADADAADAETEAAPPEAVEAAPEEQARVAEVRQMAESLTAEDLAAVRDPILQYLPVAERGLEVPRARDMAEELLAELARAARLAVAVQGDDAMYPAYRTEAIRQIAEALGAVGKAETRPGGYARLRDFEQRDARRRGIEASPAPIDAKPGLARAAYEPWALQAQMPAELKMAAGDFPAQADAVVKALGMVAADAGKDLSAPLKLLYGREVERLVKTAGEAGAAIPGNLPAAVSRMAEASRVARTLEYVLKAKAMFAAVEAYVPASSRQPILQRALGRLSDLASSPADPQWEFREWIGPFETLAEMDLSASPARMATLQRLSGRVFAPAADLFRQQIAQAVARSADGQGRYLAKVLQRRYPLTYFLLRSRGEDPSLAGLSVAATAVFSIDPSEWKPLVTKMDEAARNMLAENVARPGVSGQNEPMAALNWARLYRPVLGALEKTRDERPDGTDDFAWLLTNLARVLDPAMDLNAARRLGVGYHLIEAGRAMEAGLPQTAGYHFQILGGWSPM